MIAGDTIAAISSAVGPAARMIVRLSGPSTFSIAATTIAGPCELPAGSASIHRLHLVGLSFPAWLYCFRSPKSVTGEDVIEFHLPGNPLLARMLLDHLIASGARQADPGEFTARAYFNGRIDLAAAEGVAATVAAQSERELLAARRLLSGELAVRLRPILGLLIETLALTEVGIDFADEDVTVLSREQTADRIHQLDTALATLLAESTRFESLSHEPVVVLVGRPNAGKSTLLNALAGVERAVVSPIAGTTRDVLSADIPLRRGTIRLLDAAGLEETDTTDAISHQMRSAALRALEAADMIVLVRESTDTRPEISLPRAPDLRVTSKSDLTKKSPSISNLSVSVLTQTGIPELLNHLDTLAFGSDSGAGTLALNARHIRAVEEARSALSRAATVHSAELIAAELRDALDSLGTILGSITPDDVLGRIFSTFCLGK